ncbi:MAG: carotenoid biosynthesis protein, partial [Syntrophorhabdales bacterium]
GRELWVLGVPFMDSMSFVFLSYASYSVALFAASPRGGAGDIPHREQRTMGQFFGVTLLGALFCMYLDIIIDPVALQGARWFLGRIYGYPKGGVYFGVPISNFIGWFLVGFFLISTLQLIDRLLSPKGMKDASRPRTRPWAYLLGPALYLGVIVFNLCVTFLIGDYTLLWAGIFIVLLPSALFVPLVRTMLRGIGRGKAESPAGGTYSI